MSPEDFITSARKLLSGQPSPVDIRRAVSTAYYGIFHHVSQWIFNGVAPTGAWLSIYRALDHRTLFERCQKAQDPQWNFSRDILTYANKLVDCQKERVAADYDPAATIGFNDATAMVGSIERAIQLFNAAPNHEQRQFIMFIFITPRKL